MNLYKYPDAELEIAKEIISKLLEACKNAVVQFGEHKNYTWSINQLKSAIAEAEDK